MPLSRIIADAERLSHDPEIQDESISIDGERRPVVGVGEGPRTDSQAGDDAPLTAAEIMTLAANTDVDRDIEAETPRD